MQKQNIIRNILLTITLFCFSASPALAWGDGIPGALVNQSIQRIREGITGTILGAVKAAAVSSIINQVDRLVGGVGGTSPRMIRSYDDFLRQKPTLEAQTYVYNFLTKAYRGKSSTTNYVSANGDASAIRGNNATLLQNAALKSVQKRPYQYDLDQYCKNADKAFAEDDWRCMDAMFSNPANNVYGASLRAEAEYMAMRDEIRYQRQILATSSGFLPSVDARGNVVAPSSSIGALFNDANTLASKIITNAKNPEELVSGVVFALVNRSINTIAYKAAGAVENVVDKTVGKAVTEINRLAGDVGNTIRTVDGYILTADGYITEAGYQKEQLNALRQNANTSTTPPPAAKQ